MLIFFLIYPLVLSVNIYPTRNNLSVFLPFLLWDSNYFFHKNIILPLRVTLAP